MKFSLEQQIAVDLWLLDAILTQKDSREGRGDIDSIGEDVFDWVQGGREFYLSDGGYSRVCVNSNTHRLFLTSNSRDEVEARWDKAGSVRRRIESHIRELFRQHGVE